MRLYVRDERNQEAVNAAFWAARLPLASRPDER
jgi:hypothetical protein